MKICHYNDRRAGVIDNGLIYPLSDALVKSGHLQARHTMLDVIEALVAGPAMDIAREFKRLGAPIALMGSKLLAPIANPPSIWAAAANYKAHQEEMKERVGSYDRTELSKDDLMAEFFLKPTSSIIGPDDSVVIQKISKHVDFECELAAIIGKPARRVNEGEALNHVFGYLQCWDFSQRDPWARGRHNTRNIRKGFDTFTGLGPWIVTADEVPEPQDLNIKVAQNGKEVMTAHTSDMICGLRDHIRFLSDILTLRTGDIITTGTPAGVSRLAHGDELTGTIDRIGACSFGVIAEG
jgi:2-keto-4-pentenoate hydratase/2-oxohepta-3-ene-1,7-dioic acid hydratase in catechol pathway